MKALIVAWGSVVCERESSKPSFSLVIHPEEEHNNLRTGNFRDHIPADTQKICLSIKIISFGTVIIF